MQTYTIKDRDDAVGEAACSGVFRGKAATAADGVARVMPASAE